jgi:TPR repeat protein
MILKVRQVAKFCGSTVAGSTAARPHSTIVRLILRGGHFLAARRMGRRGKLAPPEKVPIDRLSSYGRQRVPLLQSPSETKMDANCDDFPAVLDSDGQMNVTRFLKHVRVGCGAPERGGDALGIRQSKTRGHDRDRAAAASSPVGTTEPLALTRAASVIILANMVRRMLLAAALVLVAGSAVAGPLEDGIAAKKRGDFRTAIALLMPLAEQGNPDAQVQTGLLFPLITGPGNPGAEAEAMKWFRKAAEQGNAEGQFQVGYMYEAGKGGVPQDYAEAMKWERKAAEQGNLDAQRALGFMYEKGQGVPVDNDEALKWYRKAADQGDAYAQKALPRVTDLVQQKNQQEIEHKRNVPFLAKRKDVGDRVCNESGGAVGEVENVHNNKIQIRVHNHVNGSVGLFNNPGTPARDWDSLEWINYNQVMLCEDIRD